MGSRYGRNQKRKHQEVIELLSEAVIFRERELNRISSEFSSLEYQLANWNDEIIHIIRQQYSAFSKDVQEIAVHHFHELERISEPAPIAAIMALDGPPEMFAYNPIRLIRFLCELSEEQLRDFRRIVHLRISNGRQLAFAIDSEHLHSIKHDPKFKQFLIERIAHEFSAMV